MPNPWDNDPIAQPASPFGNRPVIQERQAPLDLEIKQEQLKGERLLNDKRQQDIRNASGAPAVAASNVSGDAYLKTIDPATASMVKALSDGRKAFPSGAALRSPYWQEMLSHLSNYDPGFDEVNYTGRAATRRDFTSGKAANNIRALNTAIGHLGHLEEQIGGTASHVFTPLNAIENTGRRMFGDPGPTNFDTTVSSLAGELTAVYRGSGGAEADIQRYIQQLSPNASHDQKVGAIRNIVGLLKSRLDALNDQYRQGMGTTAQQLQLLDPQAQLIVQHLGGFDDAGAPQDGGSAAPMGGGAGGPGGPPPMPNDKMVAATGDTKEVVDSSLTPVRREYMARLNAGQSGGQLIAFLQQAGVKDPALLRRAAEQAAFRRKYPQVPIGSYDTSAIDHVTEQMGAVNKAVNALGQSDLGAGTISAGNQMLAGYGPEVVGAFGGNSEQARLNTQYSAQDHPGAALTGGIVGGTVAALGGEVALARAGMGAGFGRSLLADTGYGALAGSGASPDNRLEGGMLGAGAGALGSVAGQALTRGGGALARGVQDINVQKLVGSDTPLTIGQAVGGKIKALEDKATSFPILGDMINARRAEGVRVFNSKAFDKALEPIGATVGDQAGQEAVDKAHSLVSTAFNQALKGKSVVPDQEFMTSARGPLERLAHNKRVGKEIVNEVESLTKGLFDETTGALSGEHMQAFLDGLRQLRQGYKQDPLYQTLIKPSIQGLENSVEGMFKRQTPEVMPAFNRAKQAYRRLSILSDAVNSADNSGNVFTPAQLRRADLNNAKKYDGKISAASGSAQFNDITGPAQAVLPSKVPNSGTTDRLALLAAPGLITAGGAGVGYAAGDTRTGSETGIGLASLLAALYTKRGQSILVNAAVKRGAKTKAVGSALQKLGPVSGGAGAALSTPDR